MHDTPVRERKPGPAKRGQDDGLLELLRELAERATDRQLVVVGIVGCLTSLAAFAMLLFRGPTPSRFVGLALCLGAAAFSGWGIGEREISERRGRADEHPAVWRLLRSVCFAVFVVAMFCVFCAILRLLLGTWIS